MELKIKPFYFHCQEGAKQLKKQFPSYMALSFSALPIELLYRICFFILITGSLSAFAQDSLLVIPDANASRLFSAPTARAISEDHATLNFAEIIVPNFSYGVTDEFMIRGGFTP